MSNESDKSILRLLNYSVFEAGPSEVHGTVVDNYHRRFLSNHGELIAFNGAVRIFGDTPARMHSIREWNAESGWRSAYGALSKGLLFFAEDFLGNQFGATDVGVFRFDGETGERRRLAAGFREWTAWLVGDPENNLSLSLLRAWQAKNGSLQPDAHLCPTFPFVLAAHVSLADLHPIERTDSMRFKGNFAVQIHDLPDGSSIRLKVVE